MRRRRPSSGGGTGARARGPCGGASGRAPTAGDGSSSAGRRLRLALSVELLACAEQMGKVGLLPRDRGAVGRVTGFGGPERPRVVHGPSTAVGNAAQMVM